MDPIDLASEFEQRELEANLSIALAAARQTGESEEFCVDCGEEIPEQRRRAVPGCKRCVSCQNDLNAAQRRL